jgi:two-component system, sensor histidine kinase PdtaS
MPSTELPDLIGGIARGIVTLSDGPLLLLSADLTVLAASRSFGADFGVGATSGVVLGSLGGGEWGDADLTRGLHAAARTGLPVESFQLRLRHAERPVCEVVVNAQRLDPVPHQPTMLLLHARDVTEVRKQAKARDRLLQEKSTMLAELQHRIANSLQIIASVLLQSARQLQSSDLRGHLMDAHSRVLSVAELQKHLALSTQETVVLKDYLADLCHSIGASMIRDRYRLSIDVQVDDSVVPSAVSLSLGLIVTELLINALKHGYPEGRGGLIEVSYSAGPDGWTLCIADDGVGIPPGEAPPPGLGTSIVQALAHQLGATVATNPAGPGTRVTVIGPPMEAPEH